MSKYIPVEPEKWAEMVKAQAENARLKAEVDGLVDYLRTASEVGIKIADDNLRLKAEVERLRKAGDAMAKTIGENGVSNKGSFLDVADSIDRWNAANREQGCVVNPKKVADYLPKPPAAKDGKPTE
jgi:hypothetical protein